MGRGRTWLSVVKSHVVAHQMELKRTKDALMQTVKVAEESDICATNAAVQLSEFFVRAIEAK